MGNGQHRRPRRVRGPTGRSGSLSPATGGREWESTSPVRRVGECCWWAAATRRQRPSRPSASWWTGHPAPGFSGSIPRPGTVPYERHRDDPFPYRDQIAALANSLAQRPPSWLSYLGSSMVDEILSWSSQGPFRVVVDGTRNGDRKRREIEVDEIVSHVGFEPDNSIYRQLQVQECYATSGPHQAGCQPVGRIGRLRRSGRPGPRPPEESGARLLHRGQQELRDQFHVSDPTRRHPGEAHHRSSGEPAQSRASSNAGCLTGTWPESAVDSACTDR